MCRACPLSCTVITVVACLRILTLIILDAGQLFQRLSYCCRANLEALRIEQPTAIQSAGIPSILEGKECGTEKLYRLWKGQ